MKYIGSSGVSLNVTPFFDNGYSFVKIQMYEEIGGSLAFGSLDMILDGSEDSLKLVNEQTTGHITLEREGGNIYEIDFFIHKRTFLDNHFTVEFYCIPEREFYTTLKITTWDDITDAINSLYPGKKDIRCESDVNNGVQFYQQRETDLEFLQRLCSSFKHDIVYGFGWEGLLLKDTIGKDHENNPEPFYKLWGEQEVTQLTNYSFVYDYLLYSAPLNPWEEYESDNETLPDRTELESLNCCCMRTSSEYSIMGRDYYQAIENRRFNLRYLEGKLFTDLNILDTNMPIWKLGDVILYARRWSNDKPDPPFDTFLVKSNELFMAADSENYTDSNGLKFSWTTKLLGLKEEGEVLKREDPTGKKE